VVPWFDEEEEEEEEEKEENEDDVLNALENVEVMEDWNADSIEDEDVEGWWANGGWIDDGNPTRPIPPNAPLLACESLISVISSTKKRGKKKRWLTGKN
jgi:hypothetical protein